MNTKKLSMLLMSSALVLTLAACNDKEDVKEESTQKEKNEKETNQKQTDVKQTDESTKETNEKDSIEGIKVSENSGHEQEITKEEVKKMKTAVLNESKLSWFTTNKEVATHLTEAKIPYEKELIDNELTLEQRTIKQKVLQSKPFTYLGLENVTASYIFSDTLPYSEPIDQNDISKGFTISTLNGEDLMLRQIIYSIPDVKLKDFMQIYKEKFGEPTFEDVNVYIYHNTFTIINISSIDENTLIVNVSPDETLINKVSKTYKSFTQEAVNNDLEKKENETEANTE